MQTLKRLARIGAFGIAFFVIFGMVGFVIWASDVSPAMPEAVTALQSNDNITVSNAGGWIAFEPAMAQATPQTGFIFYPGGRVTPEAYAPLARGVADAGYYSAIILSPLNLAILDTGGAQAVIDANPQIDRWVVGGHSLGGSVAAIYSASHLETVKGLLLLAAYPLDDALASVDNLPVVSVYGTQDGIATLDEIEASRQNLPDETTFIAIEGGNHAQFGYYGPQAGDQPATISHAEQYQQTLSATLDLMRQVQ